MFLNRVVCVLFLLPVVISAAISQDKPRTEKEIRQELEEAKKHVAELEKELEAILPKVDVKPQPLPDNGFKVGEAYYLYDNRNIGASIKVIEVVDEKSILVQLEIGRTAYPEKILMMTPTKGMVDGQYYQDARDLIWKLTGTKKVSSRTVYVMEPVKKPVKK